MKGTIVLKRKTALDKSTNPASSGLSAEDLLKKHLIAVRSSANKITNTPIKNNSTLAPAAPILNSKITKLPQIKKEFERTKDISVFQELFPYLKSIQKNPEKLKQYQDLAKEFLSKARFLADFTPGIPENTLESRKTTFLDKFTANFIAASILDLYHDRPNEVRSVLDRPEGLTIAVLRGQAAQPVNQQNPSSNVIKPNEINSPMGMYNHTRNIILLNDPAITQSLMNAFVPEGENSQETASHKKRPIEIAVHEFTHALDTVKQGDNYLLDGILPGVTKQDVQIFTRAYKAINQNKTEVHDYATQNRTEGLSTIVETFIDSPETLLNGPEELKTLYKMFKSYFNHDPMELARAVA